ncbi:hypothetical protein HOF92_02260 [bacterium]|nr:hypothetical protein [bacterium]
MFPTGNFAVLPDDLPETLCLAALDVCGAPAQMPRIARQGMTVVVLGAGGKSGLLCCAALREILGSSGKLIGIERSENEPTRRLRSLNFCDELILADATSPLEVHELVSKSTQGKLADLVVNLTNVAQVEMSCMLCSKPGGIVYFFSMATSFSQAALGAEGISSDSHLVIGNGFVPGAADYTLNLIRRQDRLRQHLVNFYSHQTG